MNKEPLSEKEFEIINIIADGFRSNQRQLSAHIGLSLGMTNLLLKRLATKGYLRIRQLDRKKVQYLLTSQGIAEKARKTYSYTLKTIQSFALIRSELNRVLKAQLTPEISELLVAGSGDLADFVYLSLRDSNPSQRPVSRAGSTPASPRHGVLVLDATQGPRATTGSDQGTVHVLESLFSHLQFRPQTPLTSTSEVAQS